MDGTQLESIPPLIRRALDYWTECRGDRAMPARADLDPTEMIAILPNVVLLDVEADPLDFRYRLIGTVIEDHLAERYTGVALSEIPHQWPPSRIWSNCQKVVEDKVPLRSDIPYVGHKKDFVTVEDILLPLSSDGETVDKIMVVVEYLRPSK